MTDKQQTQSQCDQASCSSCSQTCDQNKNQNQKPQDPALRELLESNTLADRLSRIRHKVLVLSGKGGVGKSTVAANLAVALALNGKRVGLLDVDIHGPNIPKLLGLEGHVPLTRGDGLKVMSIALLLENDDDALIWRGPMKMNVIKQFLQDVEWGDLDYLVVDSPPGTGDEPLSVIQLLENPDGAVIVTTPQQVALADVRKGINFCKQLKVPVIGVVENMSGFCCPHCQEISHIFQQGGGESMAQEMNVPFIGSIPIDPAVAQACDEGQPFIYHHSKTPTAQAMQKIVEPILALDDQQPQQHQNAPQQSQPSKQESKTMRVAIPVANGQLALHFGHCEHFAIVDVDPQNKSIAEPQLLKPPAHEPGVLPRWLAEQNVNLIIAGGMGQRAQMLFTEQNINVVTGAPAQDPKTLVQHYLDGTLQTGDNICDH